MSDFLKKMSTGVLKIFSLGCVLTLLSVPVPAQEQSSKEQPPPPAAPSTAAPMRTMAPRPALEKARQAEEEQSMKVKEETLQQKKVTGEAGGQEIRAREGEEAK